MSAGKHTPGPLRAVASKTNGDYAVRSADGNIVAEFYEAIRRHDERATEEARANAELFATATDLLEALRPFANYACSPVGTCQCHNCRARDVIAKATGEAT